MFVLDGVDHAVAPTPREPELEPLQRNARSGRLDRLRRAHVSSHREDRQRVELDLLATLRTGDLLVFHRRCAARGHHVGRFALRDRLFELVDKRLRLALALVCLHAVAAQRARADAGRLKRPVRVHACTAQGQNLRARFWREFEFAGHTDYKGAYA